MKLDNDFQSLCERLASIENRLRRLENLAADDHRGQSWREKLRPKLGHFVQYEPRPLRYPPDYLSKQVLDDPPSFALVTPTLNQGQFLVATINSVLDQKYPKLSYIVQDGGSTDGTRQLIEYHNLQKIFRSEPDSGQANAINRGFANANADIMGYLNSDDLLAPGSLDYVARYFTANPKVDVVYGHRIVIDPQGMEIGRWVMPQHDNEIVKWVDYIPQETLFWRRRVWEKLRQFDESLQFALDWDFILRAQAAGFRFKRLPRFLGCFRVHDHQKTGRLKDVSQREMQMLRERSLGEKLLRQPIHRAIRKYLVKHVVLHRLYKLKLVRY